MLAPITAMQIDPIQPDEFILRRVPEDQMGSQVPRWPLPDCFDPHPSNDSDGLSVYREKYHTPVQVAAFRTRGTKPTWVARLRAGSIGELALTLHPDPRDAESGLPMRPGHALIVEMNSMARKSDAAAQWKQRLLAAVIGVEGGALGFPAPAPPHPRADALPPEKA